MRKRDAIVVLCAALARAAVPAAGQTPEKPGAGSRSPRPAASQGKPAPPPAAKPKGAEATLPADPEAAGKTVEEIIARVNNEIITLSEYEKARQTAEEDAKQECQGHCTPEQLQADIGDRRKNALRELIDQSLLVQRGKDMGRSEEHTSELQSRLHLVCRLLLEKKHMSVVSGCSVLLHTDHRQ